MKKIKKLLCMLIAVVMVMGLTTTAFAEQQGTIDGGSITINDAVVDQTYNIYQILYLESYNAGSKAYAYKANTAWESWLRTQTEYVKFDEQGYVTWIKKDTEGIDVGASEFAKLAQAKAATMNGNDGSVKATSASVKFENLKLGYYLVDTTLGTLCSLNTTNPTVVMEEKNEVPVVIKEVQEDADDLWGESNDADINQTVNYQATITVQAGAENYVLHDKMSVGLTYIGITSVKIGEDEVVDDNYTVSTLCDDGCTFEVAFNNDYISELTAGTKIVVSYSASVNEDAVIGLDGNKNEVKLEYGDKNDTTETPVDETITYVWDMDVLKYGNDNKENVLADAKFVLLNSEKTKVAKIEEGKLQEWVAFTEEADLTQYALTTDVNGKIEIDGLDADTYYLREIQAPAGYNMLANDVEVIITGAVEKENGDDSTTLTYVTAVAEINNNSGTELPSTGGMGTTVFYILGGILVLAAVVLLITKRRMSAE